MERPLGWGKILFVHTVVIGVPTIICYYLRLGGASLFGLHVAIAAVYLVTAAMICVESTIAIFRRFAAEPSAPTGLADRMVQRFKRLLGVSGARRPGPDRPVPRTTLIVVAYLPNEQFIIVETLRHLLRTVRRPSAGLEVILAYNSPVTLPIETELARLAEASPELRLLRVAGSESKAENLNAAMDLATGEITGILDADHHPHADCLERAWRWLAHDYDVVQGRSVIRNHAANFKTRLIAVEFECMYGVTHPARSLLVDTAIFGGSNGYWRTEVLRQVRFDPRKMTEDIDASVRGLLHGFRIMQDRSIVSSELAPLDFRSFWFQRKRWAQGWLEVSIGYQRQFWRSSHFSFWQKLYWTYLLSYREAYPLITLQIFPVIFSLLLLYGELPLFSHWFLWTSAIVTLLSGPYQTLSAAKNSQAHFPRHYIVTYACSVFFYVMVKNVISLVALYDHFTGQSEWVVTRRALSEELRGRKQR